MKQLRRHHDKVSVHAALIAVSTGTKAQQSLKKRHRNEVARFYRAACNADAV